MNRQLGAKELSRENKLLSNIINFSTWISKEEVHPAFPRRSQLLLAWREIWEHVGGISDGNIVGIKAIVRVA